MGPAILELKLSQELDSINQYPPLLVLLDLCKVYDTLERGCLLTTLEGYGAVPLVCRILAESWGQQEIVTQ